jgi:PIN domain nuclease of toxin-antitoxin system
MNSLLLDTHTFIWFSENDANLPSSIRETIEIAENVYVSIASLWEIAIKLSISKLLLRKGYESIEAGLETTGITYCPSHLPIRFKFANCHYTIVIPSTGC